MFIYLFIIETWGSFGYVDGVVRSFIEHGNSFINIGRFFVFNFCQFTVLISFLCFRNKDKLIKLELFLKLKKIITNFLNSLNI